MDEEHKKSVELYISKLQNLLAKVITESDEFKELKDLMGSEDGDLQLCVFSVLMDKNNMDALKNIDFSTLQNWMTDLKDNEVNGQVELDSSWLDSDKEFLKAIRISL